ncbi:ABC transporter permease [bacterium]|nr:ABC transporter permease [bacterium]
MKSTKNKYIWISILTVAIVIFLWELVTTIGLIKPVYIGTPHVILEKLLVMFSQKSFYLALANSFESFFFGFFLAIVIGVPLGLLLGIRKKAAQIAAPFIFTFNTIPYIAILPLFIIWFGIGTLAKTVMVFLMASAPIIIYTFDSTKTVDKGLIMMAKSFGKTEISNLKNIIFYHSLPYIFSGIRVAVGRGLIAVIVAEIYGLGKGIGYYVSYYGSTLQTDRLMALVIVVLFTNFLLIWFINKVKKSIVFWDKN